RCVSGTWKSPARRDDGNPKASKRCPPERELCHEGFGETAPASTSMVLVPLRHIGPKSNIHHSIHGLYRKQTVYCAAGAPPARIGGYVRPRFDSLAAHLKQE